MDSIGEEHTLPGTGPDATPAPFPDGSSFGQYRVVRFLGRGGMGEVYEVEHAVLHRRYALKLLPPDFASRPGALERFEREAHVMATFEHPNIVRVDDFGETAERYWLRMELATGLGGDPHLNSLADLADTYDGKIPVEVFTPLFLQTLAGMAHAHYKGVVHRDLKPANVLLCGDVAKVSDFGLARLVGEEWIHAQVSHSVSLTVSATASQPNSSRRGGSPANALIGTYDYMSPEQRIGHPADARSDVFSLGLLAYRLLTGRANLGRRAASDYIDGDAGHWDEVIDGAVGDDPDERWSDAGATLGRLGTGSPSQPQLSPAMPGARDGQVVIQSTDTRPMAPIARQDGQPWEAPDLAPELVPIPASVFRMGSKVGFSVSPTAALRSQGTR